MSESCKSQISDEASPQSSEGLSEQSDGCQGDDDLPVSQQLKQTASNLNTYKLAEHLDELK
jgi:hypothetical protein